jgi:hypothetical protein
MKPALGRQRSEAVRHRRGMATSDKGQETGSMCAAPPRPRHPQALCHSRTGSISEVSVLTGTLSPTSPFSRPLLSPASPCRAVPPPGNLGPQDGRSTHERDSTMPPAAVPALRRVVPTGPALGQAAALLRCSRMPERAAPVHLAQMAAQQPPQAFGRCRPRPRVAAEPSGLLAQRPAPLVDVRLPDAPGGPQEDRFLC